MSLPFFQSQTGDPASLLRRMAVQSLSGVPATTGWVDFYSNGGPLAPVPSNIQRNVITGNSQRQVPLVGPTDLPGSPLALGDLDPASKVHLWLLAAFAGKYTATNPTSGVYKYVISSTASTAAATRFTLLSSEGNGIPTRYTDVLPSGYTLAASPGQNLILAVPVLASKYDYHGDPVQTAGSGSTSPILRHTWTGNFDTADKDIYVKIIDESPLTIKVKIGAATTYDGASIVLTSATWGYLNDGTALNLPLGGRSEQIQAYFASGATLVADDEFRIPARRTIWTPSFATAQPVPVVNTRIYLGSDEIQTASWTITANKPGAVRLTGTSSRQAHGVQVRGAAEYSISLQRKYVDLDLQKALLAGTTVSMVKECIGGQIGSTSYEYGMTWVFPALRATGPAYGIAEGGQNDDETITLEAAQASSAFTYNGTGYTDDATVIAFTNLSSIAS